MPRSIAAAVAAKYASWGPSGAPFVEGMIFEDLSPAAIDESVQAFCRRHLGTLVTDCHFYHVSIASVFGLQMNDGRRLVLHAYRPWRSQDFLQKMVEVQRKLLAAGFPCPTPLLGPAPLGKTFATLEELVDVEDADGDVEPHSPAIRNELATSLARLVSIASAVEGVEAAFALAPG